MRRKRGIAQVPALLLQPLVENAIEHGMDPSPDECEVRLKAACNKGILTISIRDRGRRLFFADRPAQRATGCPMPGSD